MQVPSWRFAHAQNKRHPNLVSHRDWLPHVLLLRLHSVMDKVKVLPLLAMQQTEVIEPGPECEWIADKSDVAVIRINAARRGQSVLMFGCDKGWIPVGLYKASEAE